MKRSVRFTILFILYICAMMFYLLSATAKYIRFVSAQSEASVRHKVIGCAKEPRGECVGDECNCSKWIIEWRDPAGRVWGISEAKTLQKLIEDRDRDLAFERGYARFFQIAFDNKFSNPSEPICDGCRPSAPSSATRSGLAAIQTAASLYDEWTRKVVEGMLSLKNVIFMPQATYVNSSFRNSGTLLKDYANALGVVNRNLKHLRQDMSYTERQLGRLTSNLESSTADLRQATDIMTTAYAKLPSDLRNVLEGGATAHRDVLDGSRLIGGSPWAYQVRIVGSNVVYTDQGRERHTMSLSDIDWSRSGKDKEYGFWQLICRSGECVRMENASTARSYVLVFDCRPSGDDRPCREFFDTAKAASPTAIPK